jgi:molecular chaperone GrpE
VAKKLHPAAELAAYKTGQIKSNSEQELEDKYLRLAAEFDNYKKRAARQYAEIIRNANEDLIQELLTVLDDFHHALESTNIVNDENQTSGCESLIAGMKMIYDKFLTLLSGRGVRQIDVLGQPFDPQYHDAVMQMPSDKEEGTVIGVIAPGYMLNDKVIRHAKVIVASRKDDN